MALVALEMQVAKILQTCEVEVGSGIRGTWKVYQVPKKAKQKK